MRSSPTPPQLRDEFYTFQIGVYAPVALIHTLPRWSSLAGPGGASIDAWRIRCINRPNGSAQATAGVGVPVGGVQPLWFGVDVPADAPAGVYHGHITIAEVGGGGAREEVELELTVGAQLIEQHGDSELWRHSRLRWLDSQVAPSID